MTQEEEISADGDDVRAHVLVHEGSTSSQDDVMQLGWGWENMDRELVERFGAPTHDIPHWKPARRKKTK